MVTKFQALREATPRLPPTVLPEHLFISKNDKTGWSINVAIAETCQPTRACAEYCYGLGGRIVMDASLHRQAENARFFAARPMWEIRSEAEDVVHVVSRTQNFLRMFGVGDLQPGSVEFVSWMARYASVRRPGFRIWVATRKFELATGLPDSSNLHVMMSLDATTPAKKLEKARELLERGPTWFAAWVRRHEDERVPDWVTVVFEEHKWGGKRARREPDPRACPATVLGGADHSGACSRCQYCFDLDKREGGTALTQLQRRR
jgi:hypothetical protein